MEIEREKIMPYKTSIVSKTYREARTFAIEEMQQTGLLVYQLKCIKIRPKHYIRDESGAEIILDHEFTFEGYVFDRNDVKSQEAK